LTQGEKRATQFSITRVIISTEAVVRIKIKRPIKYGIDLRSGFPQIIHHVAPMETMPHYKFAGPNKILRFDRATQKVFFIKKITKQNN